MVPGQPGFTRVSVVRPRPDRPVSEVFAFISDPEDQPRSNYSVIRCLKLDAGPAYVASTRSAVTPTLSRRWTLPLGRCCAPVAARADWWARSPVAHRRPRSAIRPHSPRHWPELRRDPWRRAGKLWRPAGRAQHAIYPT